MKKFTHLPVVLGALLFLTLLNGAAVAEAKDLCRATSQKASRSCQAGAESDYWLALGKCHNLADPAAREACREQAKADRKDALEECQDQRAARQAVCDRVGKEPYDPVIDPANFVTTIDNPYLPLTPGTTYIYEGNTAEGFEHQEFVVTNNTKVILGVTCIEVRDTVTLDGELIEDTLDWFAQDVDGNVWYFGENSKELVGGQIVSLEGSWEAGVDGAKPGIIMEANPLLGDFYRQEFYLGEAEDIGEVLSLTESVSVPYGPFNNCLKTADTVPLEPDALEHKFYAPGIGLVLEIDPVTGDRLELIQIIIAP